MSQNNAVEIPEPKLARFLFADTRFAWFWLVVRLYVGWQWLQAGWEKINSAAWAGSAAGTALKGFLAAALQKTAGAHPDVAGWYGAFLTHAVIPHATAFSYIITFGELLVGIAIILGAFTGIAAFFSAMMNVNYLFAGTLSINPLLLLIELFLILAWRTAGWWGLDRYVLPELGTPWQKGKAFKKE